jgi:GNAT superfamily N-acetyltransferase
MEDLMAKSSNGAWLALGVAGAVAAASAVIRRSGSSAKISNTSDLGQGFTLVWGDNELDKPEVTIFHGDKWIGFANAWPWEDHGDDWFVNSLYIDEPFRGKGFGQWLVLALSEAVRSHTKNPKTKLTPGDWLAREEPGYVRGKSGTSQAALRVWDRLGGRPI